MHHDSFPPLCCLRALILIIQVGPKMWCSTLECQNAQYCSKALLSWAKLLRLDFETVLALSILCSLMLLCASFRIAIEKLKKKHTLQTQDNAQRRYVSSAQSLSPEKTKQLLLFCCVWEKLCNPHLGAVFLQLPFYT